MKAPGGGSGSRRARAFALIDLLALIVVVGMISLVLLPALARVEDHGRRMACLNNLRQLGVGLMAYAQSSGDKLFGPLAAGSARNQIALDSTTGAIASSFGLGITNTASTALWTCPSRPGLPLFEQSTGQYIIGYQYLAAIPTWQNPAGSFTSVSPAKLSSAKPHWVLAADAVIKVSGVWGALERGREYAYTNMPPHHTDDSRFPQGGNELFVDGSARWIGFEQMFFLQSWSPATRAAFFYQDPKDFPPALVSALSTLRAVP